jgi:alpha-1,2-mannosyltransferase
MKNDPRYWLTARRLRAHATILAVCLWSVYVWNLTNPGLRDRSGNLKGTDFLHLYTLGSLAAEHDGADLYDMNAQAALAERPVPAAAGLRYLPLYPPQVSIFFAPLAQLSYGWALAVWWVFSATIYGICCYYLWRACPNLRAYGTLVAVAALAFPGFFHLIAWGQTPVLALACFTLAFFLLRDRRQFFAGLVLGCLVFKPQLGLAAGVVFVATAGWKILLGAALSAAVQLSIGVFYYGVEPLRRWAHLMLHVRQVLPLLEPRPYQTHCLRTFWSMLIPWPNLSFGLYIVSAAAVLGVTVACWKRKSASLALRYSSLLLATVLVAPHLTVYDLVILAPAFLLLADWLVRQSPNAAAGSLGILLYLAYMLPLLGPLARWTHVQLSVVAMAAAILVIFRLQREEHSGEMGI